MTATHRPRPTPDELALARDLLALGPQLAKLMWRAAGTCGLGSPERSRLLAALGRAPQRAGQLAQQLKLSPATVSELVDALAAEGLVRRGGDPEDRRAVVLELTTEGRRQRQHYEQVVAALLAEVVGRLTPTQQRRLRQAFTDIRTAFISAPQDAPIVRASATKERTHVR